MIEIISVKDIKDATPEELANLRRKGLLPAEGTRRTSGRPLSPYERTRAQVAATGNRCRSWSDVSKNGTDGYMEKMQ